MNKYQLVIVNPSRCLNNTLFPIHCLECNLYSVISRTQSIFYWLSEFEFCKIHMLILPIEKPRFDYKISFLVCLCMVDISKGKWFAMFSDYFRTPHNVLCSVYVYIVPYISKYPLFFCHCIQINRCSQYKISGFAYMHMTPFRMFSAQFFNWSRTG